MTSQNDPLEDEFPLGDGTADALADVYCPYCGEPDEMFVDPAGGAHQEYVEDCSVCCRPWHVTARFDSAGGLTVELRAEDEP